MSEPRDSEPRVDRTAFTVFGSFQEADAADAAYWRSRIPEGRWAHLELLRRINFGERASRRIQPVLEAVSALSYAGSGKSPSPLP